MFKTEVDIESLSKRATNRWKRKFVSSADPGPTKAESKRLRSFISTSKPENFCNLSSTLTPFSPRVTSQEDLPEISAELSSLRKKHDINRGSNFFHEKNISNLQKQLDSYKLDELKARSRFEKLKNEEERLENILKETCKKQEDALEARKVYCHIIERMKIHKIRQEITREENKLLEKANNKLLIDEKILQIKQQDTKTKAKQALSTLENYVKEETLNKQKILKNLQTEIIKKQENNSKREERHKRQLEIAERAANEDREISATQMREDVLLMRFYYSFIGKKLENDMKKQLNIEEAFEKVRRSTTINDASEMIAKVLTTEVSYTELKKLVNDVNENIVFTKKKIEDIEKKLNSTEKMKVPNTGKDFLQKEINEKILVVSETHQRLMRLKGVQDNILLWTEKILNLFGFPNQQKNIFARMDKIRILVKELAGTGKGSEKLNLRAVIDSLENRLKKFRTESERELYNGVENYRDLVHYSPVFDVKPKK